MDSIWIPRNEGGTVATLQQMAGLAKAGLRDLNCEAVGPLFIDSFLRDRWDYEWLQQNPATGEIGQVIRTIPRMMADYARTGKFRGACADAAVLAATMLLGNRAQLSSGDPAYYATSLLVAVRSPRQLHFEHVFVVSYFGARIDPTAPRTADYACWESKAISF